MGRLGPILGAGSLLILSLSASGETLKLEGVPPPGSAERPVILESIIREGYDRLVRLVATGGSQLQFELGDFRTYNRNQLGMIRFGDLVDLPGGESIGTGKTTEYDEAGRIDRIYHTAAWQNRGDDIGTKGGRSELEMTVESTLAAAATSEPALLRVTAATSFRVTAHLEGRSRSYRACVWWIESGADPERVQLIINDNVTTGVAEAFGDFDSLEAFERGVQEGATWNNRLRDFHLQLQG